MPIAVNQQVHGIDLIDNRFYGPMEKLVGFLGGRGKLDENRGNIIAPYENDPPRPDLEVKSIDEWLLKHAAGAPAATVANDAAP